MATTAQKLLIVDDSRVSRMLIKGIVTEKRPQWELLETGSGDEALALLATSQPDFITMDVNMPGINGLEAARQIRAAHPHIRIALCTANIQSTVRNAAAEDGIFFVAKPITEASVTLAITHFEA